MRLPFLLPLKTLRLGALILLALAPMARAESLVLKNYTGRELLERMQCGSDFRKDFCTLLSVFDGTDDFQFWVDRCHGDLSVEALYEQPDFACHRDGVASHVAYHTEPMSLLTHLTIRFPGANTLTKEAFRHYLEQGRPEAFTALLNRPGAGGRTHLDILAEREANRRYMGTEAPGMENRRDYACILGGRYAKQPQPASCQRRDALFSDDFIQRAQSRAKP